MANLVRRQVAEAMKAAFRDIGRHRAEYAAEKASLCTLRTRGQKRAYFTRIIPTKKGLGKATEDLDTSAASLASSSRTNGLRPVMTATASNSDRDPSSRNSRVPSWEAWAGYASHRATSAFALRPPRDVAGAAMISSASGRISRSISDIRA